LEIKAILKENGSYFYIAWIIMTLMLVAEDLHLDSAYDSFLHEANSGPEVQAIEIT